MYHPTRPGVRGGRDQFKWDDVKVDKHRENYIGHSLKAPVGRWQKGKDLFWYTRDKNSEGAEKDALKAEIQRVKEEEEQMMREALGFAPKRATRPKGNRIDKHEFSELVKRGSTAEDLGAGHAEAAAVHGLGFARAPRAWEEPSTLPPSSMEITAKPTEGKDTAEPSSKNRTEEDSEDEKRQRKRSRDEKKQDRIGKHESSREEKKRDRHGKHEKRHSRDSDDRRKHRKDKERRRHDSD